jgi:hypothetical protein
LKPVVIPFVSGLLETTTLTMMPRTTLIGRSSANSADDNATMHDFIRVLVEIATADCSAEQLFADDALNDCLRLILAKNRGLLDLGGTPWPEDLLTQVARSHFTALRMAQRH